MDNSAPIVNSSVAAGLQADLQQLQTKLASATLPEDLREKSARLLARSSNTVEFEVAAKYVDWALQIPFNRYSTDQLDLTAARTVLEREHFGLLAVKEHLVEYIASRNLLAKRATQVENSLNDRSGAPILCFVGVQGVGKTTMAKTFATALNRRFQRIALGAFANVAELRGRSRAEVAAEPGQIVKALVRAGSMNPVILLDEVDKVSDSGGVRADVMAALLEVLDPEQNHAFMDRYLDYPIDLSQVLFVTTANNLNGISAALLDRLEVLRFPSYSDEEKVNIAQNYLLPKVRQQTGIGPELLEVSPAAWPLLVRPLGFDPGIRQLERNLVQLCRKVARMIVEGYQGKVVITAENFRQFFPEQIAVMS